MYIKSLELKHFRNYETLSLEPDPGINIFYGDNAQGKTNILEAIYLAGTTKSHRGAKDKEMIIFDQDEAHIRMAVEKKSVPHRIDMHLRKARAKGISIDGIPIRRAAELYGLVNMVFFSPEDLNIIKNGPAERRRFLDSEICQLSGIYLDALTNYNKIIIQRNKLLKDIAVTGKGVDTLDIWDLQMVHYGREIVKSRREFLDKLNPVIRRLHAQLTGGREEICLTYEPSVTEEEFETALAASREKDRRMCQTFVGPHRDDFSVLANGIDMRTYGSQGQQRTAALALKLSEIELLKESIHDTPVLLLDDVLSELDSSRQNYLLGSISGIQTLITCTGLDDFVENQFQINRVFRVENGVVTI